MNAEPTVHMVEPILSIWLSSMTFEGTANGAAAASMAKSGTGATDCFMDVNFVREHGIVCKPANWSVCMADGSTVIAALQTPIESKNSGIHSNSALLSAGSSAAI